MNRNIKILVIEDEGAIRNLISTALQTNDINMKLHQMVHLHYRCYQLISMIWFSVDLGLPDIDGVEIIRKYRTFSTTPIIVVLEIR